MIFSSIKINVSIHYSGYSWDGFCTTNGDFTGIDFTWNIQREDPAGDIDDSFRIQASFPLGRLQSTHPPKVGRGLQPWRILQMLKSMGIKEQGLCGVLGYFFLNSDILY